MAPSPLEPQPPRAMHPSAQNRPFRISRQTHPSPDTPSIQPQASRTPLNYRSNLTLTGSCIGPVENRFLWKGSGMGSSRTLRRTNRVLQRIGLSFNNAHLQLFAQYLLDLLDDFIGAGDGFDEKIIRSHLKRLADLVAGAFCGKDDDWDLFEFGAGPQGLEDFKSVHDRHHQVQEDEVRFIQGQSLQGLDAII